MGQCGVIPGMSVVADRVERAIRNHERIAVFGDFDVDGITSTCLLTEALRTFGADATPFIPHRFDEGYGSSRAALDRVNKLAQPNLIVTVDNGIAARKRSPIWRAWESIWWLRTIMSRPTRCRRACP